MTPLRHLQASVQLVEVFTPRCPARSGTACVRDIPVHTNRQPAAIAQWIPAQYVAVKHQRRCGVVAAAVQSPVAVAPEVGVTSQPAPVMQSLQHSRLPCP